MFPLGLLSIIQVAFLPGWIVLRLLGLTGGGVLRTIALAFPLSLLFNHLLVCVLTAVGVNLPPVLWGVFAAESLLAVYLLKNPPAAPRSDDIGSDWDRLRALIARLLEEPRPAMICGLLGLALTAGVFLLTLDRAIDASASVFSGWDAVVSWNRWAVDWYNNRLPERTANYPQLVPTTISTTYTFAATPEIQFFAMAVMALFPLVMLAAIADLALRTGLVRYAWAAVAVGVLFPKFLAQFSMSGYADEPVATMTALTVYALILGSHAPDWRAAKRLFVVGALCGAAAALTKQAGWHLALLYPILAVLIVRRGNSSEMARAAAGAALLIVAVAGPWHLYRYLVPAGNEMLYVLKLIHGDRTFPQRAAFAAEWAAGALGWPLWLLYIVAPASLVLSLLDRSWRWVTLLVTLPLTVMWLLFLGYTHRNAAAAVPLTIIGGAVGVAKMIELLPRPRPEARAGMLRLGVVAAVALGVVWPAFTVVRYSRLLKAQQRMQRDIGDRHINAALYRYSERRGFDGRIISNYQVLPWLPGFEDLYTYHSFQGWRALKQLRDLLDGEEHKFVLYRGGKPLPECVDELVASGRLKQVTAGDGFTLFRAEPPALEGAAHKAAAGAP